MTARLFGAAMVVLLVGACRTSEEALAERNAEIQTLVGITMAEFSRRTGLIPSDAYPTNSGKTFVVQGASSTLMQPGFNGVPAVARSYQCQMLVETEATDTRGTADTWRVTRITHSGPC